MSGQPAFIYQGHVSHRVLDRSQGFATSLTLLLLADGLIFLTALLLGNLNGGLSQVMAALGALSCMSLVITAWIAAQHATDLRCHGLLILNAAWVYWYLLPMLMAGVRGKIFLDQQVHDFGPEKIAQACIAVLLVKFVATLVYQVVIARPLLPVERISTWLNRRYYETPWLPVAGLLGLGLVPFAFSAKPLLSAILSSRSADGVFPTTNFGGTGTAWFGFTSFLTACCLLAFYQFLMRRQSVGKWLVFFLGCAALTVFALAVSTRTMLILSVMPALSFYVLGSPDRWRVAKVLAGIFALWVAADLIASSRTLGFQKNPQQKLSRNLVDNDFFVELLFVVSTVPNQVRYDYQDPVLLAPIAVIPRALWHDKPTSAAGEGVIRIRANLFSGDLTGNMLPGLVGQYWEVAGWIGLVVLGIWLGTAFALWDSIVQSSNWNIRYIAFTFAWAAFISFRTFALSNLLPAIFCAAMILLFSRRTQSAAPTAAGRVQGSMHAYRD